MKFSAETDSQIAALLMVIGTVTVAHAAVKYGKKAYRRVRKSK